MVAMNSGADGGIQAEVMAKHGHSAQPESQQVVAVLNALRDVIITEALPASPTSYFAAAMSALEKPETRSSVQVAQAMCTLLAVVLPRVPTGVLRSKFVGASNLVASLLQEHKDHAACVKAAVQVLGQLLAAGADPTAWHAAVGPLATLLSFALDARPKVRKRVQGSLVEVLAALQGAPGALAPASDAVSKLCVRVLQGPEAAARAAAAASNKQRGAAEDAIAGAVSDALHALGALKGLLPLLSEAATKAVVDAAFRLYPLKQPLLSRHATEALVSLVGGSTSHLSPAALSDLVMVVVEAGEGLWDRRDPDCVLSLTRLVEAGLLRLAEVNPALCARALPRAVHALVPQLGAEQDGVRFGTSQALRNLIRHCVDDSMVVAALSAHAAGAPRGQTPAAPLESVLAAVAGALGARYQEAWPLALPVVGELVEVLGERQLGGGRTLAGPLVEALGVLVAGGEDAAEDAATAGVRTSGALAAAGLDAAAAPAHGSAAAAAHAALGCALRSLGAPAVLGVLPLNIKAGLEGTGEARTWMLPLLRRHVCGTELGYWQAQLLPLARTLATRAASYAKAGRTQQAHTCQVLELQVWSTLPAFVSWATDFPAVFPVLAKEMGGAFTARHDLQGPILAALERAALQARRVLREDGTHPELIGFAAPLGVLGGDEDEDDDEYGRPSHARHARGSHHKEEGGDHHATPPTAYTTDHAVACVSALRGMAKNWMSVMCKAFVDAPPEGRGALARTLSAYAAVADPAVTATFFRTCLGRLVKIMEDSAADVPPPDMVTDGGSDPVSRRVTYTELALVLAPGLDDAGCATLLKACKPALSDPRESALQKKGYKVLAYLCEHRPSFLRAHLGEVLGLVVGSTCLSAAKRYRLRTLKPLIIVLAGNEPLPEGALPAAENADDDEEEEDGMEQAAPATDLVHKRRQEVVASLVSELMLCCKEANMRARSQAYELLVQIAHAMDDMDPGKAGAGRRRRGPPSPFMADSDDEGGSGGAGGSDSDDEDGMEGLEGRGGAGASSSGGPPVSGGLANLFAMVMAGLAGQTPHMISASVMALARLLYEFAGRLEPLVPELLPAVCMLLRSKAREVIKAVLGFIKVCALRMPVDMLVPNLDMLLEGMLLWAEDSKNKFRLKIRVIIERLAKRCGFDEVAKHVPPAHARLLTHIRKQNNRKQRLRSEAGSQAGDEADGAGDARSRKSGMTARTSQTAGAKTARASQWGATDIFSDDEGEEGETGGGRGGARSVRSGRTAGTTTAGGRGGMRLQERGGGGDPMDLLDASASRALVKSAAARGERVREQHTDDFRRNDDGRMVIEEMDAGGGRSKGKRKRGGDDDYDSADSDFEDLRQYGGLDRAMRDASKSPAYQRAMAASVKSFGAQSSGAKSAGGKSQGAKSVGGRSMGARSEGGRSAGGVSKKGPSLHSGDRFKSGKAGGDVKGRAKVEPYAYWQFDRKLLNRRPAKKRAATSNFGNLVAASVAGAKKGGVAHARAQAKARSRQ